MKKSANYIVFLFVFLGITVTSCKEEITSISLKQTSIEIKQDESIKLELLYEPTDGVIESAEWTSYDEYIATVGTDGTVKGLRNGSTTIRLDVNNSFSAYCEVKVVGNRIKIGGKEYPITEAKLENQGYFLGDLTQFKLYLNYKKGSEVIETFYYFLTDSPENLENTYAYNLVPNNGSLLSGGITPHLVAGVEQTTINGGNLMFSALNGENNYDVEIDVNCLNGKNVTGYYHNISVSEE